MAYTDDLKFLWNLVWCPSKFAKKQMKFGEAVMLYYKLAILPFIAYILVGTIAVAAGIGIHATSMHLLGGVVAQLSYVALVLAGIFTFFIAIPIGMAIDALIYQLIGKFFLNVWKGTYEKTFTALVFSSFPALMLLWLSILPVLNSIFIIIVPIWVLVILVIAISMQQKTTRLNTMIIVILKSLLVLFVLFLIGISIFAAVAYALGGVLTSGFPGSFGGLGGSGMAMNWHNSSTMILP